MQRGVEDVNRTEMQKVQQIDKWKRRERRANEFNLKMEFELEISKDGNFFSVLQEDLQKILFKLKKRMKEI